MRKEERGHRWLTMGECLCVWEYSGGCGNNKAAKWACKRVRRRTWKRHAPVAQRAINVCVCLRTIASLSLGRGSLRIMWSIKSFGMTEAMFHFNFPSTTSSQSWKIEKKVSVSSNWVSWQNLLSQRVKWRAAMPPLTVKKITVHPYSQRKWLCKKSNISPLYLSSLYLIICMPFSFLASFVFISPACDKLCPA